MVFFWASHRWVPIMCAKWAKFCERFQGCLSFEKSWAAKPLGGKGPNSLRNATVLTSVLSTVLAFVCIIFFSSVAWDELSLAAGKGHPGGTVFFLTWLYYIHFLNAVLIFGSSIMCLIGMCLSPHGVPGTCRCPGFGSISMVLLASRSLRVAFWTAFLTIWVIVLVGEDTCHNIDEADIVRQQRQMCDCLGAEGALATDDERDHYATLATACKPKSFNTCLMREDSEWGSDLLGRLIGSNNTVCGYECLIDQPDTLYDHAECTRQACNNVDDMFGCYWGEYTCPARVEDFEGAVYLRNPYRYCRYSAEGDLLSTNFSPVRPTMTDLDEELHVDLQALTMDIEDSTHGANGGTVRSALQESGLIGDEVCTFRPGDGNCHGDGSCSEKMIAGSTADGTYIGPVGGIYPRSAPDPREGIWSAEACAEYVMETEPSANGATYSGIKTRAGDAFSGSSGVGYP